MQPHAVRLAPSPLRPALLLLVPLALLASVLLGLLAQSATAEHAPVPGPGLTGPISPGKATAPEWSFITPSPESVPGTPKFDGAATRTVDVQRTYATQCIYGPAPAVDTDFSAATPTCHVVFAPERSTYVGAVSSEGSYTLSVRTVETTVTTTTVDDGSGPVPSDATSSAYSAVESQSYVYDNTAPAASVSTPAAAGQTSVTWDLMATDAVGPVTLTCVLVSPTGVRTPVDPCAAPSVTTALTATEGTWSLEVTPTDEAGNVGATATGTYDLQLPPAAPEVSAPAVTGNDTSIDWTFSNPGGATATCALSGPGITAPQSVGCTSPHSTTLAGDDGTYTLTVTLTDGGGSTSGSADYLLDRQDPTAVPSAPTGPSGTGQTTPLTWTVDTLADHTTQCLLTTNGAAGSWTPCPGSYSIDPVNGSTYSLQARYVDAAGNPGAPSGASASYTYDTTAPAAPVIATEPGVTGFDETPVWTFTPESGASVTCRVTGGTLAGTVGSCSGPGTHTVDLKNQPDGSYILTVTITDGGGLTTAVSATYVLDRVAPSAPVVTLADTSPTSPSPTADVTWNIAGGADVARTECRLERGGLQVYDWRLCGPSVTERLSVEGSYVLLVRQFDAAGNVSSGSSDTFTIDNTPPGAPVVTGSGTSSQTPSLRWDLAHSDPVGTRFTCSLVVNGNAGGFVDCPTPYELSLTVEGTYRVDVYAYDAAGNRSTMTTGPTYTYDITPPAAPAVSVTPATDNVASAAWSVVPAEPGTTSECRLVHSAGGVQTEIFDWTTCTSFAFPLTEGDGSYQLSVRSVDAALNVGPGASASYVLDQTPPDVPLVGSNRTTTDNERSVTYTFSGEGTATCQLVKDGTALGEPVTGCTSGYTVTLPDESGRYVLQVTYTDSVGNTSDPGSSPVYELDVSPPVVPVVTSDRTGTDNEPVVTYTFSGEGSATCQLTRDGAPVSLEVACISPYVVTLPSTDGSYVLLVRYTDAVGNTSTAGASPAYVLDLTPPPAPVVSGPPTTGNTRSVSWSYSGEGSATCTLLRDGAAVGGEFACGATGFSTTLTTDGSWTLQVTFTDAVGNRGPPGSSSPYVLDTVAPVAPTASGPTGPSQSRSPSWTLSTESGTTTECRLVRGGTVVNDWASCSGGFAADLTALPDGAYALESRATDAAGNVSAVGASAAYVLDTIAPVAPVVTGPSGPSQSRNPGFTWTSEAGATAQCQLTRDGAVVGDWVACASGYTPTLGQDGTWTLAVRLTDAAGNLSDPASSGGYVLDTSAPPTPVVTPPGTPGRDLAPSWGAVVEGGSTLECRLTGPDGVVGAWAGCTMPHVTGLQGRPDGAYVLEVRSTDAAGNVSPIGSGTYVLDTVAPAAAVVVSPSGPGRTRTPSFTFTTEPGARTSCRLSSGATLVADFAACTSPTSLDLTGLPDGTYTLTVRVTDAAGNPGPAATGTYVLDTTAPAAPVFTLLPATPSPSRSVTLDFSYEAGSTLVCRLTFPTGAVREISACAGPLTIDLTGLPDGSYTLSVRAVDAAGNVGPAATAVHVIDSAALAAPEVSGPVTPGTDHTPTWILTVPAGTADCRLMRGTTVLRDWAACSSSYTADLFGQPDGTYTLHVRTTLDGVVSATTRSRYVLDTTPPGAATLVAPPTPSTNRMPTWSIASPEQGATAMCRVLVFGSVLRDWAACAVSPAGALHTVDLTGLGDGSYTLEVRLTDAAGNVGTTTATSTYVLDTSAPVAVGVTGPPSPGNDRDPTWLLSTSGGTELECRLSSAAGVVADWAPCAGEYTADLTELPDGTYTLAVRAVSAAGTPGPETTSAYVLNTTGPAAPTAVALSGVRSPSNDRSPTWTFTLPTGTAGHCRVVQGTRVVFDGVCASPFTLDLSSAGDGTYTLTVSAVDAAGNRTSAAPSSYVLDTAPTEQPVLTLVPGATGSTLDPQWGFTVVRGATAQCRLLYRGSALDDWASCTSPYTAALTGRPDGEYVLQVRAVDAAGNTSEPVSDSYLLDRTAPPVATFTATPVTPDNATEVSWTVTAPDGATLECRLVAPDGSTAWGPCGSISGGALRTTSALAVSSTIRLDLRGRPDGDYVLEVRVVQADGTVGAVSRATYRLDTTSPAAPVFSDIPAAAGNSATPAWLWEADGDVLVECRLMRAGGAAVTGWVECADGQYVADLTRLGQGSYALEIRLTDAAGNVGPVTSAAYRYDTTAPAAPVFTTRPPASGADRTVSWTFAVPADTTATCTVTRDFGVIRSESACSGRYDLNLSGLPDGTYTLTVRYTDSAGNVGTSSSSSYGLATLRAGGPVRIDPPPAPFEPAPISGGGSAPLPGPGRTGTGTGAGPAAPARGGSTSGPAVPTIPVDDDVVRSSDSRPGTNAPTAAAPDRPDAAPSEPEPEPSGNSAPLELDAPVPDVIRDVAIGTIKRPTLPLALLAIVVLFLLAQNRIDRRDPKLAAAPVEAEPELDFTAYVGRLEGTRT